MSGIILLSIIAAWFYVVKKLAQLCVRKMQEGYKKTIAYIVVFSLLFIVPVADEVVGGFQFRALCKKGSRLIYVAEEVKDKTVWWSEKPRKEVANTILTIKEAVIYGVDPVTKKQLVEYKNYYATGGWLSRSIAFNSVTRPYIFNGSCGLKEQLIKFEKEFNLTSAYK